MEQLTAFIGTYPSIPLTTSPRPVTARVGELRFNVTTDHMEIYDGTNWNVITEPSNSSKLKIAIGKEKFGDCHYWVQVTVPGLFSERREKNLEIDEWVEKTYGPKSTWGYGRWTGADERYWFKEEKDRDWFILRWTE